MSRVLRSRLGIVQMLASLTIYNLAHADKCIDFLLSENDKRQWQVLALVKWRKMHFSNFLAQFSWILFPTNLNCRLKLPAAAWGGRCMKRCWRKPPAPRKQSRRWWRWTTAETQKQLCWFLNREIGKLRKQVLVFLFWTFDLILKFSSD